MGLPKRKIIDGAFEEIGLRGYDLDLQPEQMMAALRKLDAMMATWAGSGIRIGYAGGDGEGDLDVETDCPVWADDAMVLGLAVRLAPSFGKVPSAETKSMAAAAHRVVMNKTAQPSNRPVSGYGGNGYRIPVPAPDITLGNDGTLDLGGCT